MRLCAQLLVFAGFLIALSGLSFALTSDCSDGTAYFDCSTKSPGYLCGPSGLVLYVQQCPCDQFPGYVQEGTGDTATCVLAKCSDGTEAGECSAEKPKDCLNGVLVDNATKCGCPEGKRIAANQLKCEFIPCDDGGVSVPEGTCSPKRGKKCVGGELVDKASECGCPSGQVADGEVCGIVCSDGTGEGECSDTLPKECVNGYLLDNAEKCGCPSGQTIVGKRCSTGAATIGGSELLEGGNSFEEEQTVEEGTTGLKSLSCCCMPTALIGIAAGFVFFRRKR